MNHPGFAAGALAVLFIGAELAGLPVVARIVGLVTGLFTAFAVLVVLSFSSPLPKVHARSLLTERLGWLWRFGVGALVLCTAGVLSVYFAHEFARQDANATPEERLITAAMEVGLAAALLGIFIFLLWVVVDLARLGVRSRSAAIAVGLRRLRLPHDGRLAQWCGFASRPWWALLVLLVVVGPGLQLMVDLGE